MKFCWHTRKFSIALLAWAPACITSEPTIQPVSLKVELPSSADESKSTKSAENLSINMSPTEKIKKLEAFIAKDSQNEKLTRDIRIMLAAEEAQVNGFIEVAEAKWLEATLIARRSFAQHAFERWVDQMLANAAQAPQLDMFAELILLKTESGKANDYMVSKPLRNKSQLKEWLLNRYKGRLISEEAPSIAEKISGISPKSDGPPLNDSLLLSTASDYCRSLDATDKAWMDWQNSLGFQLKSYFNALVQKCMGETTKALASFSAIYPTLEKNPKYGQYALQTSKEIIQLSRTQGDRGLMADTYLNLAKLWERKEFNEEALNLSGLDLDLMKIDDFLWAARYRAMVGDYENAKIYTQKSLDLNAAAFAKHNLRSRNREKEKLTLLRLEAFQLLAFRIAIETRDYDAALSYFEVAERIEGLKDTALMDILWHKGLTFYLKNEVKLAFDVWKSTAQRFKGKMESSYEARSLFWLARSAKELGYSESSSYANELIEKYALNYYAVIALNYSQIEGKWDRDLLDHEAMVAQLQNPSKLDINELRSRSTIGELLMRAEVTINLGLETYDKLAVADFAKELTSSYALSRVPHSYIYLTRLYNATNILLKSISLNTELAATFGEYWKKWPEQAYVYFPQPHLEVFRRNAHETGIDAELLISIARQESGFEESASSPAGALGLMQIMPATALSLSRNLGVTSESDVRQQLQKAEFNIAIGSRYLEKLREHYRGFYPAVFAGYNAGEYAVDRWMKARHHVDPLIWVELIPFLETRNYVKNTWRNLSVYKTLYQKSPDQALLGADWLPNHKSIAKSVITAQ